jgi:hypothetical protein
MALEDFPAVAGRAAIRLPVDPQLFERGLATHAQLKRIGFCSSSDGEATRLSASFVEAQRCTGNATRMLDQRVARSLPA